MIVKPNEVYGELRTKWSWKTHSNGRVWKCECIHCGATYYIREDGITSGLVPECVCHESSEEVS